MDPKSFNKLTSWLAIILGLIIAIGMFVFVMIAEEISPGSWDADSTTFLLVMILPGIIYIVLGIFNLRGQAFRLSLIWGIIGTLVSLIFLIIGIGAISLAVSIMMIINARRFIK